MPKHAFADDWEPEKSSNMVVRAPGMDALKVSLAKPDKIAEGVSAMECEKGLKLVIPLLSSENSPLLLKQQLEERFVTSSKKLAAFHKHCVLFLVYKFVNCVTKSLCIKRHFVCFLKPKSWFFNLSFLSYTVANQSVTTT